MSFQDLISAGPNAEKIIIGFLLSSLIAYLSIRVKALTLSGGIGAIIIGTIVFGRGGLIYAVPLVFFFVSSSLLSLVKPARKLTALERIGKSGPRDIRQVLANGVIAAAVILIAGTEDFGDFLIFLLAVCAPAADTWATEIGTLSKRLPVSIVRFKKLETGQSGGVTWLGLTAAFMGAFLTGLSGLGLWYLIYDSKYIVAGLIGVTVFAVFGSIVDSILGDSAQGQYRCQKCGLITEKDDHCNQPTVLIRGLRIINNDAVNLTSILLALILFITYLSGFSDIIF